MDTYSLRSVRIFWMAAIIVPAIIIALWALLPHTSAHAENERIITIYHDNLTQTVATNAETVSEVLARAQIVVGASDVVEPAEDTKLVSSNYSINIYRARPVTIVDGMQRYRILTPHTSAKKIAESAGLTAYDEDVFELDRIDDFLEGGGVGLRLTIKRSTPLTLVLYGKIIQARTQATTIEQLLKEKGIELSAEDSVIPEAVTPIAADMTVSVYRNGSQLVSEEQEIAFPIEHIQNTDQAIGYRQIKEAGAKGKKVLTFQIELRDGNEISRKEIQSVVTVQPKKQIEIVGVKQTGFTGDFAAALARLRSCEGSYTSVNPAGYYGAYQFNISTWRGAAPEGYKDIRPDQAPPAVQDQAARNLYVRRGWQPWPACSRKLGLQDIYR